MNGVAITTSSEVVKFAQTSSGRRQNRGKRVSALPSGKR